MKIELLPDDFEEKPEDKKRFYTIDEAGEILNLSRGAIWRIRQRKEIGFFKFGQKVFFTMDQLEDFIKNSEVKRAI